MSNFITLLPFLGEIFSAGAGFSELSSTASSVYGVLEPLIQFIAILVNVL